jgi:hypothetical protein
MRSSVQIFGSVGGRSPSCLQVQLARSEHVRGRHAEDRPLSGHRGGQSQGEHRGGGDLSLSDAGRVDRPPPRNVAVGVVEHPVVELPEGDRVAAAGDVGHEARGDEGGAEAGQQNRQHAASQKRCDGQDGEGDGFSVLGHGESVAPRPGRSLEGSRKIRERRVRNPGKSGSRPTARCGTTSVDWGRPRVSDGGSPCARAGCRG